MKTKRFKRGDVVHLGFPGELIAEQKYLVSATSPDNCLSDDRADICEFGDLESFNAKRGIGMPIKYLTHVAS